MADTIAEFIAAINFKADTRELSEIEKKAKEAAEKSAKAWEKFGSVVKTVGVGALGAAGGLLAFVERSADSAAQIDIMAKRAGIGARELQRLQFAATKAGAGSAELADAFKTLDRQIVEARKGAGPAAEAFRALGLSATSLVDMNAEQRFAVLADSLAKLEDPTLRGKIALDLFGGSGDKLLPMLADGSAGLARVGDEAERLGLVLSNDAVAGAAKFDKELKGAKAELGAFARDIGLSLIPAVRSMIRDFDSWAVAAGGLAVGIAAIKLTQLPGQLGLAASSMSTLALRTGGAVTAALALGVALGTALDNALGLSDAIAGVDQDVGSRGAVLFGALTPAERAELAKAESQRDLHNEQLESFAVRTGPGGHIIRQAAEAEQAKIDSIHARAKGRAEATAKNVANVARDRTTVGRFVGEGLLAEGQRGVDKATELNKAAAKKKTGGKKKEFVEDISAGQFEADELFGDDLRRLAERNGVGEIAVDAAIKAAAESLAGGSTELVAKDAALSTLGQRAGKDFGRSKSKDPLLSQIFGDNDVPDIELSAIARGAEPQVLISNITNTFNFDIDQMIDGTGDPGAVADRAAQAFRDFSRDSISAATKTAKVAFAR